MLSRRLFILGTLSYGAIILYGSLVPLHFQPLSFSELFQQFTTVCTTPIRNISRSDFLANILLLVPLSFLVMGSFLYGRPSRGWFLLIPVTLLCALYGASIECLQLIFPPRNSSLSDMLAQSIGSATGGLLWILAGASLTKQVNTLTGRLETSHRLFRFLPLYLLMIVILETAPFDFSLSPVELVHKWREGRIGVVPFAAFLDPDRNMVTKSFWNIVLFLPVGLLLGLKQNQRNFHVLCVGLLIAAGVESMQLFVLSRFFEPTDIIIGGSSIWLGWSLMQRQGAWTINRASLALSVPSLLLILWCVLVLAINWSPFNFTWSGALDRLSELPMVPFADYQQKHYLSAFDDLVHKLLLFVLLGILLSANSVIGRNPVGVTCLGGLLSAVIEMGQALLPSRYPSVSDVVLGSVGSLVGYCIASAVRSADLTTMQLRVDH